MSLKSMSRRGVMLAGLGLVGGAVTGCTISKNGKVITGSLNVARVSAYIHAFEVGGQALSQAPIVQKIIGTSNLAIAHTVLEDIDQIGVSFSNATNGQVTVSLDNTNVKSILNTVATDAQTLLSAVVNTIPTAQMSALEETIRDDAAALQTVVALFQAMIVPGTTTTSSVLMPKAEPVTPLTEAQAFKVLGLPQPPAA